MLTHKDQRHVGVNGERALRWYADKIGPEVEATGRGRFVVINVETGEYEIDDDDLAATRRARARFPDAPLFTLRVGYPAAYRLGSCAGNLRAR